jgi:hypothetical protein
MRRRTAGSHLAAVAGLVAAAALMPAAAAATGVNDFDWQVDAGPLAKGSGTLTGVTVVDAELWVVGTVSDPTTGWTRGMVGRGPGDFRMFPAGDPDPALNVELNDVDSAGDDVWVVGRSWSQTGPERPRLVRYDRRDPDSGGQGYPLPDAGALRGIDMRAPDDGWAVGSSGTRTLVLHWDGTAWTRIPSPSPGTDFDELTAVTARAADDVWAVGHTAGPDPMRTLVLHWDGTEWTRIPSPNLVDGANELLGVGVAGNDVWAVGYGNPDGKDLDEDIRRAVAMRWDGQAWLVLPSLSARATQFNGVTATSDTDVWFSGYALLHPEVFHIEHWDGSTLRDSHVEIPRYSGHIASALGAITGGASNGPLWAVGWQLTDRVPLHQPAILRHDR